jgi:hypothetical protein
MKVCWEDIQQYKSISDDHARIDRIQDIINKFLDDGAPVELNLPAKMKLKVSELKSAIENFNKGVHVTLSGVLNSLESHCKQDIMEVFLRFKKTGQYQQIQKEIITNMQQEQLLKKTGM